MRQPVSIVIPAWNESNHIATTLQTLHESRREVVWWDELIVIDDGSTDNTYEQALPYADKIIIHMQNKGKGAALEAGCSQAEHSIILLLDADLGESAAHAIKLIEPVSHHNIDMTIAKFPQSNKKAGFGLVKRLATYGIYSLSGFIATAPLSGQRAVRKHCIQSIGLSKGFGIEVGLTIDAARKGYKIQEVEVPFKHRETGRDWDGFVHRGKQFVSVSRALWDKWWNSVC